MNKQPLTAKHRCHDDYSNRIYYGYRIKSAVELLKDKLKEGINPDGSNLSISGALEWIDEAFSDISERRMKPKKFNKENMIGGLNKNVRTRR